ncbi:MAG: EamA family transporter [Actinomycetes bacterium]
MVEGLVPVAVQAQPDRRARTGYVMVVTAALLWAVNGTVSKVMLVGGMPAADLAELRATGAFACLLAIVLVTAPRTLRMTRRELPAVAVYGLVGFVFVQLLYFVAIKRLEVGIALLIEFTAPVFVALWARFVLKEPVRGRVWAALALSVGGLSLVAQVWQGGTLDGIGVLAAFGAAVSLAVYFLLGEHNVGRRDPVSLTCLAFGFTTLFWAVVRPWWRFPYELLGRDISLLGNLADRQLPMWVLAAWLIVLGTVVPFTLSVGALRHLRAAQVGLVGMVEPVAASVVAFLWLGEQLGIVQIVGGAVVLVGVVLAETARR